MGDEISLATASCDLWQNEQRSTSSEPVLVLTEKLLYLARCQPGLRVPVLHFPSLRNGQEPCCSCEKSAPIGHWQPSCDHIQCYCTTPIQPQFAASQGIVVPNRIQLSKQCRQILRTRQGLSFAPYLCLKMMSSMMPYSFDCCAFMMKSRSTSRSTFSSRWPVCFDSN